MDYITVLTTPKPCNKKVRLNKEGEVVKTAQANDGSGTASTRHVPDCATFAAVLHEIADDPRKCLVQGYLPGTTEYQVMSRGAIERVHPGYTGGLVDVNGRPTTARLKATFSPSSWIQFDRDFAPGLPQEFADMTDSEWLEAIGTFAPGVDTVPHVHLASTSGRVTLDGVPLDAKGGRFWMQIQDPADYAAFGQRLKFAALAAGFGFMKQNKSNQTPWSLFDQTVFSWERLVFDGSPSVQKHARLGLNPPSIDIVPGHGVVDSHACAMPDEMSLARIAKEYGLQATRDGGQLQAVVNGQLTLQTKIVTKKGMMTVKDFVQSGEDKLRCQATFRESESWNGLLRNVNGVPFLYDNGTHTKYELSDDGKTAAADMATADFNAVAAQIAAPKKAAQVGPYRRLNMMDLPDLEMGESGPLRTQRATPANVKWVCDCWGVILQFNECNNRAEFILEGERESMIVLEVYGELLRCGISMSVDNVHRMLGRLAQQDRFHPFEAWLDELPAWDGKDHIAALTASVTTETPLWPVYLRKWLIQLVAGVRGWRGGGMQLPHVLTFAGKHGLGKSTFFKNLLPAEFYTGEAALHLNSGNAKDHMIKALKTPLTELAEIDSTFSRSDIGQLKSFLSTEQDEIRKPFGVEADLRPRMTTFGGTVNDESFLRDSTGNRRFWPVHVTAFNWDHGIDMRQLFAQVDTLQGESFYLEAEHKAQHEASSEEHRLTSVAEDYFYKYFTEEVLAKPKDLWRVANTTEIYTLISGGERVTSPAERSLLTQLLRKHFGKPRRLAGRQKVYLVPVADENDVTIPKCYA